MGSGLAWGRLLRTPFGLGDPAGGVVYWEHPQESRREEAICPDDRSEKDQRKTRERFEIDQRKT